MGFACVIGQGLVTQNINPCIEKSARGRVVDMVGRRDHDCVNTIEASSLGLSHL